jgi:L-seryl-tRNA(Ser) seleniumtransferase
MLTLNAEELESRAGRLLAAITTHSAAPPHCRTAPAFSAVGGGSFPSAELPTTVVVLDPGPIGAATLALKLRLGSPAIIGRVQDEQVMLDPRTLPAERLDAIGAAVARALAGD